MPRAPSRLRSSRTIHPLRSRWGRTRSISKRRRPCRGCASALQHAGRVRRHFQRPCPPGCCEGHIGSIPAIVVPCIATTLRKGEYPPHMKEMPDLSHPPLRSGWGIYHRNADCRIKAVGPGGVGVECLGVPGDRAKVTGAFSVRLNLAAMPALQRKLTRIFRQIRPRR